MPLFLEIKIRKNGEEKWVDARKFFDYMIKEYSKVTYKGKSIDPYPDRVNKFYNDIPEEFPIATLLPPVLTSSRALYPKATFPSPVVRPTKASLPTATF